MSAEIHDLHSSRGRHATEMPNNLEAEQALLGAILINNDAFDRVSDFLRPDHFSEELHRRIYDVASQLIRAGKVATPITLRTFLGDTDLGGVTIPQYLARLVAEATSIINTKDYGRTVYDLAMRHKLVVIGEELVALARDPSPSTTCIEIAAGPLEALRKVAESAVATDTRRDAAQSAAAIVEQARAIMRGEKRDAGASTGLPELDRATGGFRPGELWVVGGRPRMGKTILGTGFARKVAARGARALANGEPAWGSQIFSLEVTEEQIVARLLADIAYTPRRPTSFGQIMRGDLEEEDLWAIEEAQTQLATIPLALDVAPSLTVLEIAARVRSEKGRMAKMGVKLALVVVDYLKFVRATDRYRGNRVYEVGEITRGLKELAKLEGVCIVLLAQVNRAIDGRDRKDKAPGLADLRESGDLEADADVVLFIDRESVRVKQSPEYRSGDADAVERFIDLEHRADLIVAKTRTGSERTVQIWIDAGASTFAGSERGGIA